MTKAQTLYDLREETGFVSGLDLHDFFYWQVGDQSPSGHVDISTEEALDLFNAAMRCIEHNSPSSALTEGEKREARAKIIGG
jgi:hypothetical protein